jgi:hypothetical protein
MMILREEEMEKKKAIALESESQNLGVIQLPVTGGLSSGISVFLMVNKLAERVVGTRMSS